MKAIGLFSFLFIYSSIIFAQWERTNGPEGGQITMLETIGDTTFLGTIVKGLYYTIDDGLTWNPLNAGIEHLEVTSIVTNGSYLFVGTGFNGVYHSNDGGQTWTEASSGSSLDVSSLVVKDGYLFAGTWSNGVYRSADNGVTWEESLPGFLESIFAMCVIENTVYASSYGITRASDDNGANWYEVDQLASGFIWSFYKTDDLFIAGATNRIFRSLDQGSTFEIIDIPFLYFGADILSITAIDETLYIGTSFYGVYKSTNNGTTWSPVDGGMGPKDVRSLTTTPSSTLLAGVRSAGVFRSTNGGDFWNKSNSGLVAGSTNLAMLSYQSNIYAGTVDDGVYKTMDNGETWMKLSSDVDTIHYGDIRGLCAKDAVVYASTRYHISATIYKYLPNDDKWVRCSQGLPQTLEGVRGLETSGNNVLAATSAGLYYSSDGGANWQLTDLPAPEADGVASAGNGLVYATVPGAIYKSTNDGISWTLNKITGSEMLDISAIDNFVWVGTRFSGALYSDDYGSSWYTCNGFPSNTSVFAIEPVSDGMVLAAISIVPWLYASFDDGATFSSYGEGVVPRLPVESLAVNETFMFAGSNFSGVWRRSNPFYVSIQEASNDKETISLYQNYPNPFAIQTTIRYDIPKEGMVVLEIFTIGGDKLSTLVNKFEQAGQHEIEFNSGSLENGLYYYRLRSGNISSTKKMLIFK